MTSVLAAPGKPLASDARVLAEAVEAELAPVCEVLDRHRAGESFLAPRRRP
jgi:hypothetical protein